MGQALRRASGRIRSSGVDTSPSPSSSSQLKKQVVDRTPPAVPLDKLPDDTAGSDSNAASKFNSDNMLEEKDPQYDAMLSKMVGRIQTKPGGKSEMGEAFVVERYNRPMPKLRNTKYDSGRYEERPVPSGTLNISQLRHIVLLHEGKADDHNGPMNVNQIAEKFRIDVTQDERILQFVALPLEDSNNQKKNELLQSALFRCSDALYAQKHHHHYLYSLSTAYMKGLLFSPLKLLVPRMSCRMICWKEDFEDLKVLVVVEIAIPM